MQSEELLISWWNIQFPLLEEQHEKWCICLLYGTLVSMIKLYYKLAFSMTMIQFTCKMMLYNQIFFFPGTDLIHTSAILEISSLFFWLCHPLSYLNPLEHPALFLHYHLIFSLVLWPLSLSGVLSHGWLVVVIVFSVL